MTIYIFNPEHDIALASNLEHFTAPHAGRQLRHDLGFLPALWASQGDFVLVDDKDSAIEGLRRLGISSNAQFVEPSELSALLEVVKSPVNVLPWGWDTSLRHDLLRYGVPSNYLPSNARLNVARQISHRAWAAKNLLPQLTQTEGTVGKSWQLESIEDISKLLSDEKALVLKAPWSSSGRGIRYVESITPQLSGWINNVILRQGSIMAEPYYNKVCDFGMEFLSKGNGDIDYCGLSVFQTTNGAYTGNLLDDEAHKEMLLCKYIPQELLLNIAHQIRVITSTAIGKAYAGPFGVDMMIVRKDNKLFVHPCVELNLRMTMGHVGILLSKKYGFENKVMRISYNGSSYKMKIESI